LVVYPIFLLASWSGQEPMRNEFLSLLNSALNMNGMGAEEVSKLADEFFKVDTDIIDKTGWVFLHCKLGVVAVYMQFLQLIFYFNAHPAMAVLTKTVSKASSQIIHFLMLFSLLFVMLAFIAFWQLGTQIPHFATFGDAISTQGRMLFGEFIYADGAAKLHTTDMILYWTYAFTFMLLMFFILLNFFLAIIVDAFVCVKADIEEMTTDRSFVYDCFATLRTGLYIKTRGWMTRREVIEFCEEVIERRKQEARPNHKSVILSEDEEEIDEKKPTCDIEAFVNAHKENLDLAESRWKQGAEDNVLSMLAYYHNMCEVLRCKSGMDHLFVGDD